MFSARMRSISAAKKALLSWKDSRSLPSFSSSCASCSSLRRCFSLLCCATSSSSTTLDCSEAQAESASMSCRSSERRSSSSMLRVPVTLSRSPAMSCSSSMMRAFAEASSLTRLSLRLESSSQRELSSSVRCLSATAARERYFSCSACSASRFCETSRSSLSSIAIRLVCSSDPELIFSSSLLRSLVASPSSRWRLVTWALKSAICLFAFSSRALSFVLPETCISSCLLSRSFSFSRLTSTSSLRLAAAALSARASDPPRSAASRRCWASRLRISLALSAALTSSRFSSMDSFSWRVSARRFSRAWMRPSLSFAAPELAVASARSLCSLEIVPVSDST
eukprot:comp18571_c0_seq1/m.33427 comp18571_c0_seq1/g.33427  ORF comp18571_c0_seq1/g.33427 comp18571_c0_seq1/m.33427 type:complete len:338 (+) comp18571_c0_seq1:237-1250(+)